MNIVILGGTNNEKGELNNYTKNRIIKCHQMLSNIKDKDNTIHFSGGFNKKFNKTTTSHSEICKNYFEELNKNKYNIKKQMHIKNNNTVDESINFGKYFQYSNSEIKIITNDWHINRVKYLFDKVFDFYEITKYEFVSIESKIPDKKLIEYEINKIKQIKEKPYGDWKKWLINNYYKKYVKLRLVKVNETDGRIIVEMRNENNKYFFNSDTFYWDSFKKIFYGKYFSNELPTYFVLFKDNIIGFIGCKTIKKNVNDIGIMFFKDYHSKGFGTVGLSKFLDNYNKKYKVVQKNKKIIAKIFKSNIGSYKIFINNKFILDKINTTNDIYYLYYK